MVGVTGFEPAASSSRTRLSLPARSRASRSRRSEKVRCIGWTGLLRPVVGAPADYLLTPTRGPPTVDVTCHHRRARPVWAHRSRVAGAHCSRSRPLRTGLAGFLASGSSKSRGCRGCSRRVTVVCRCSAVAVGVCETDPVRWVVPPVRGHGFVGDRFLGGGEPLFPLFGGSWLVVGGQEVVPASGATALLLLGQVQGVAVERWWVSAPPTGPVAGQGRVVCGRCSFDQLVSDDSGPGELLEEQAAVAVSEHPSVLPARLNWP